MGQQQCFEMENSCRKSIWDAYAKERNPSLPFEIAIVLDSNDSESKRSVRAPPFASLSVLSIISAIVIRRFGTKAHLIFVGDDAGVRRGPRPTPIHSVVECRPHS